MEKFTKTNLKSKKAAVVLFNLGGPDSLNSVQSFLFNLFYDKAIIKLPNPLRFFIAKLISKTRANKAKEVYSIIGGKSPLLEESLNQKNELDKELSNIRELEFKTFICMRHWHPMSSEVAGLIKEYDPTQIVLLPLYPQFSTTTTGSSIDDFTRSVKKLGIKAKIKIICCYPIENDFIKSHITLIKESISKLKNNSNFRILFSAHSLPVSIIKEGDPYQWQIEKTVKEVVNNLKIDNLDYKITYQSKVGPVKWLTPSTENEINSTCLLKKPIIIVPIAFVSEHVETLVELDVEYAEIAKIHDVEYIRVPTLRCEKLFIKSIARTVEKFLMAEKDDICASSDLTRICPNNFSKCRCNILN